MKVALFSDLHGNIDLKAAIHLVPDKWKKLKYETCGANVPSTTLREAYGYIGADGIAYGHAHQHHAIWLDSKLLLSVASIGLREDGMSAFTLLEYADEPWIVQQYLIPYDVKEETRLMVERGVPQP